MKPQIRLRYFEYIPRHRNEYDSHFWVEASLQAMVDLADVPPRRARRLVLRLGARLIAHALFDMVFIHYKPQRLLLVCVSPSSAKEDFSAHDFRELKPYIADLREIAEEFGARVLPWSKRASESIPVADY